MTTNNNYKPVNTNTKGISFKNIEGTNPSALNVGFWNQMVSLEFCLPLPESERTEQRFFDYENKLMTSLSLLNVEALVTKYKEELEEKILNGESCSAFVTLGVASLVGIKNEPDEKGDMVARLYYIKCNDDRSIESSISYTFARQLVFEINDISKMDYTLSHTNSITELTLFMKLLEEHTKATTNAHAHSGRVVNRYMNDKVYEKLGVIGGGKGNNQQNRPNIFNVPGGDKGPTQPESMNSVDDFMN